MNTKRVLIACTAFAALGLAFAASRNGDTLTTRIDTAIHDLEKAHAPIPHAALHARALDILHSMTLTVAKDDEPNLDPCIAFDKKPIAQGPCR